MKNRVKNYITILFVLTLLIGCSQKQTYSIINASKSGNAKKALISLAETQGKEYLKNPNALKADLKKLENIVQAFEDLHKAVSNVWGEKDAKEPSAKKYVKYIDNYKSRAIIDYEKGIVTVGTIDSSNTLIVLKNAIIMTLLMPSDPSAEDLFNSNSIKLEGEPYLYEEVLDNEGVAIRWEWRASKYADYLIENSMRTYKLENGKIAYYVQIPMTKKHEDIRANKYQDIVRTYAKKYGVEEKLIYAIIKTESDFNQYAISKSGAVGLMQIMPATAGADAYKELYKKEGIPTREYLFDPKNNIEMGSLYIYILKNRYLKDVVNSTSKEYCVISAYNGGSGTVLKTFNSDKTKAFDEINKKTSSQIYTILTTKVPYEETRNYLIKVQQHKKLF